MGKGRCDFQNLIRKASAFFAVAIAATTLTGCGDAVTRFLQDNNLANKDYYSDEELFSEETESGSADTEDSAEADSQNDNTEENSTGWSGDAASDGTDYAKSEGTSFGETASDGESADEAETESKEQNTESSVADQSESAEENDDSSANSDTIDIESVNKKIDNLISQIEQETGRVRNTEDSESQDSDEEENGTDSTTYFSETYQNAQRKSLGITEVDIPLLKEAQKGNYAFEHLTEEGKTLYVELLSIIQHHAEDVVVSTLDPETLDVVYNFVQADHPEIFYMDGYTYTRYTIGGELKKISFTGDYTYTAEEIADRQSKIDSYVIKCLAGAPTEGGDYEKVKYVYDYLITNTEYDMSAPDNQNICSVFLYGKSICQGYARATQYLLQQMGIPATLVIGKVNGGGHAWNLVYVDGEYTYVDTTWGDSSYQKTESGGSSQKIPLINYTYLCCTTQDISKTHTFSETLPMPKCTSMKNNYYVREGEYFTEADMGAVAELFKRRYADGSNNVTFKCSTKEVYDELLRQLIDSQQVFGFIEGSNGTVSYTTFDEQYILIIWLY